MKPCRNILFVLLLCVFQSLNAHPKEAPSFRIGHPHLPLFVATFMGASIDTENTLSIRLSDDSQWVVPNCPHDVYDAVSSWSYGDDIRIRREGHTPHMYVLCNVQTRAVFRAYVDTSYTFPMCAVISDVDQNGYVILTHGENLWVVGYLGSFSTMHWRRGDRILINKGEYSKWEDYLLINLDADSYAWTSLVCWQ